MSDVSDVGGEGGGGGGSLVPTLSTRCATRGGGGSLVPTLSTRCATRGGGSLVPTLSTRCATRGRGEGGSLVPTLSTRWPPPPPPGQREYSPKKILMHFLGFPWHSEHFSIFTPPPPLWTEGQKLWKHYLRIILRICAVITLWLLTFFSSCLVIFSQLYIHVLFYEYRANHAFIWKYMRPITSDNLPSSNRKINAFSLN